MSQSKDNEPAPVEKYKRYRTPYGINLLSQMIKHQNQILIDNYCYKENISDKKKNEIKEKLLKVNNYTPQVIQSKHKEQLQKHLL